MIHLIKFGIPLLRPILITSTNFLWLISSNLECSILLLHHSQISFSNSRFASSSSSSAHFKTIPIIFIHPNKIFQNQFCHHVIISISVLCLLKNFKIIYQIGISEENKYLLILNSRSHNRSPIVCNRCGEEGHPRKWWWANSIYFLVSLVKERRRVIYLICIRVK